jgi:hypothetical protein
VAITEPNGARMMRFGGQNRSRCGQIIAPGDHRRSAEVSAHSTSGISIRRNIALRIFGHARDVKAEKLRSNS